MSGRLQDKVVVVTGGAGGIGRACVSLFLSEGARVMIADVNELSGRQALSEFREKGHGSTIAYCKCDVVSEENITSLMHSVIGKFGRIDCLLNNAGSIGNLGSIVHGSTEDWDKSYQIILRAAMLGIKHAAPLMRAGGSVINTASIAGLSGGIAGAAYSANKAALLGLTRRAAVELAPLKIRVNAICPGFILTPMICKGSATEMESILSRSQPWPEPGRPEHVAQTALFLASDESRFITGESIVVDGGKMANGPGVFDEGNPLGEVLLADAGAHTRTVQKVESEFTNADWD